MQLAMLALSSSNSNYVKVDIGDDSNSVDGQDGQEEDELARMKANTKHKWKYKCTIDKRLYEFSTLFCIQIVSYTLWCVNYRATAQARYNATALTDFMISTINFFVIRKIAQSNDGRIHQWAGYSLGSVSGSYIGIWMSKELGWKSSN